MNRKELNSNTYSKDELKEMLLQMRNLSSGFYSGACRIGNHPFIEFCGLMNEYIKMCEEAFDRGEDFTEFSTHRGQHLEMKPHNLKYIREKLDCIFGNHNL